MRLAACSAQNEQLEGVKIGLEVLSLLGISLPDQPTQADIFRGLEETKAVLAGKTIDELASLPEMTDEQKRAATAILLNLYHHTYTAAPALFPLVVFQLVNLMVHYGNTPLSARAYAGYGVILCGMAGDIEAGYEFGKLAMSLVRRFDAQEIKGSTIMIFNAFIRHWKEHTRETLNPLVEAYQIGLETGDLSFGTMSAFIYGLHAYWVGMNLRRLEAELTKYSKAFDQLKQEHMRSLNEIFRQSVSNLQGKTKDPCRLVGESYDEDAMLPLLRETGNSNALVLLYINKAHLCFVFRAFSQALEQVCLAEPLLDATVGAPAVPAFYLYDSLSRLAVLCESESSQREEFLAKVTANQEKMRVWAQYAPMNHLHKYYLVEAERARVQEEEDAARRYYDQAIDLAREHGYVNEEALACELAAQFYLASEHTRLARYYLNDAHYAYLQWGALAKVKDLEAQYPQFLRRETTKRPSTTSTTDSGEHDSSTLDLNSVLKASQAISGEIVLGRLLDRLMTVVMENAGAQRGYLILEEEGQLAIEAESTIDRANGTVLQSVPVETSQDLALTIVRYVERTKESVVLSDATTEGAFTTDLYIARTRPKSILCAPLINQGRLVGIIYLENDSTAGAFTPERLEVVNLLSSQAVISIENARLYKSVEKANAQLEDYSKNLERKVEERTQELQEKNQELEIANQQVQEANQRKSQFLASMSHELRTPLNSVIGFSDVLLEKMFGELNERQEDYLHDIASSGHHLLSLINDILDLSKIEAGRMEFEPSVFSLREVLEGSLVMVRERAFNHGVALSLDVADDIETIFGDERKVKQILFNLLSNAVKFTPDKGRIGIRAKKMNGTVQIAVWDTGVGIAPEDQGRIFEEFQQGGREGQMGKVEGTGLGLALAKSFVELHGGKIWVDSAPGTGSTFTFTLPVTGAVFHVPISVDPDDTGTQPVEVVPVLGSRVLVIEDDPKAVDLLRLYLTQAGYRVDVAMDGVEGIEKIRHQSPDIVILDVLLPKVDGWDFLRQVKEDPALKNIPIIIVSIVDQKGKGFALGAAEYLVKPIHKEDLLEKLDALGLAAEEPAAPLKILVIDDDPKVVELLTAVLTHEGFHVRGAAGGEEGVAVAKTEHPDGIILDLVMPGLNGFDVLDQLEAFSVTEQIPIILFTVKQLTAEEKARVKGRIALLAQKQDFTRRGFVGTVREVLQRPLGRRKTHGSSEHSRH